MSMRKTYGLIAFCPVVLMAVAVPWWLSHQDHAEYEHRYQALAAAIPPHSTRETVEQLLKKRHLEYRRGYGPGSVAMDDQVDLNPGKYLHSLLCDHQSPSVLIRFDGSASEKQRRTVPAKPPLGNPVYSTFDLPDDEVIGISYELICNDDL